jgi:hypothetical protein
VLSFWGGEVLAVLLVVEVVLDWRLRKGREGSRKVGNGEDGEGMLMGGMIVDVAFEMLRLVHGMPLRRGREGDTIRKHTVLHCDR